MIGKSIEYKVKSPCNFGVIISVNRRGSKVYWNGEKWRSDIVDAKIYLTPASIKKATVAAKDSIMYGSTMAWDTPIFYEVAAISSKYTLRGLREAQDLLEDRKNSGGMF